MTDEALRVPEVAHRLGIDDTEVYDLIFKGELAAAKGTDGLVYVRESTLDAYERRHQSTVY
jgi:excisionase family DNA binding protein